MLRISYGAKKKGRAKREFPMRGSAGSCSHPAAAEEAVADDGTLGASRSTAATGLGDAGPQGRKSLRPN